MKTILDLSEYPVIDWDLGARLAGNSREIAEELLTILTATLANDIKKIHHSYVNKNYQTLAAELHKLHGATSYCAAPRLKQVVAAYEKAIKQNNLTELSDLMQMLDAESQLLLVSFNK